MTHDIQRVLDELHRLGEEISDFEISGDSDVETQYERLLSFIASHEAYRSQISEELVRNVRAYRSARQGRGGFLTIDSLAYCMHVLRWPEIYDAAVDEHAQFFSPRRDTTLLRIIDSFDEDWPDADCYRRFGGGATTDA